MEIHTKATGTITKSTAKEYINLQMENFMKGSGVTMREADKDALIVKMAVILVTG